FLDLLCLCLLIWCPPPSTLFPYTTLFRSALKGSQLAAFRRRKLWFVFQDFNLLDTLTIGENIALPLVLERLAPREIQAAVQEVRSEEHTSELQSRENLVCRLLLEKKTNPS